MKQNTVLGLVVPLVSFGLCIFFTGLAIGVNQLAHAKYSLSTMQGGISYVANIEGDFNWKGCDLDASITLGDTTPFSIHLEQEEYNCTTTT